MACTWAGRQIGRSRRIVLTWQESIPYLLLRTSATPPPYTLCMTLCRHHPPSSPPHESHAASLHPSHGTAPPPHSTICTASCHRRPLPSARRCAIAALCTRLPSFAQPRTTVALHMSSHYEHPYPPHIIDPPRLHLAPGLPLPSAYPLFALFVVPLVQKKHVS
ncbi:hypothetical protein GUJ93_ZPchr0013g36078 [Zizania palustris]|uniref:Uncharacterized protein n=1 Tax=Zizania palustris TaxID=103762 RepID=A0A8J5WWU1_ZIZPA|nr:hypothetical protein GUJ93_ZPchr0013g36078 [Zizania palustris]